MKILHSADWHLCEWLGRVDRTGDLRSRVETIAGLCDEHRVDVLLVAGDLFSEQASVEQMTCALNHLHETFAPFFGHGGTILAVTGNHDRDTRVEMVRAGMRLATVPRPGGGPLVTGRMYLQNGPGFATLEAAGERVQFALIPYPTLRRYAEPGDSFRSKDEENRAFQGRIAEWVKGVPSRPDFDPRLPTVLVAHLHVRGAEIHTLYKLTERDDVVFDTGFLPTSWAYIALGHVHKQQDLGKMAHVRYPGSLDQLHFDERAGDQGIVLLDIGPSGLHGDPCWLPLRPTPLYDVTVADPEAELPALAERYPDHETAIVRISVTQTAGGPSRDEVTRQLRRTFPRYTEITWTRPAVADGGPPARGVQPRADYRTTVREFLAGRLEGDMDKADVLALAETFLISEAPQ